MDWDADIEIVTDLDPARVDDILAEVEEDVLARYDPREGVLRLRHRLRAAHYGAALVETAAWLTGEALPAVRRQARGGLVLRLTMAPRGLPLADLEG
ncbi:hypothetical protein [Paractinoplanes lichenicola]|uniref:Uncharacterized protein n=1 Tax=Paractinoplanes lichenicola TaxID=2802976 RepID=A0ABS1VEN4_9ACTN|nr:hypothetical protein [Actinoplanes lichenicola]MBL7253093.1 hypothetical protein [Actinoplanes lichenicola]